MIYILEFSRPMGSNHPLGQARYYLGYCEDGRLDERVQEHRSGTGAAITRAAVARGIDFKVVVTMKGDRKKERKLKNQKNTPKLVRRLLKNGNVNRCT